MDVFRTAEVRWFRSGAIPDDVRAWFDALGPEVQAESRTDRYLMPASEALGVKHREGRIEAKRRTGALGQFAVGGCEADIEAWAKWSFPQAGTAMPSDGWIGVSKTRRQRQAPSRSCRLELAEVTVGGERWWSVCLEAAGVDDVARRAALVDAGREWLLSDAAPALPAEAARGYPAWLRALAE